MTQDNIDLTENRIPFGLLEPDVQKRMQVWEHGWECCALGDGNYWLTIKYPHWDDSSVYRAKPAPVEPERVTVWVNIYPSWLNSHDSPEESDHHALHGRLALWRITYDKDTGLNPVIEVEGEQDE